MPQPLLPRTAAPSKAHDERPSPLLNVDRKIPNWLRPTLSGLYPRQGSGKCSRWTDNDYFTRLTELLSSKTAIWTLCSFSLESLFSKNNHQLMETLEVIEIEAFIVSVDTKMRNEVLFKLTYDTIQSLITFHRDHFSVNMGPSAQNLLSDFTQAVNKVVFIVESTVLKCLNLTAGGTFSVKEAEIVEKRIVGLFNHIPLGGIDPDVVSMNDHTVEIPGPVDSAGPATITLGHYDSNYGACSHSQDAAQRGFSMQEAQRVYGSYQTLPYPSVIAEGLKFPSPNSGDGSNFWYFGG